MTYRLNYIFQRILMIEDIDTSNVITTLNPLSTSNGRTRRRIKGSIKSFMTIKI